MQSSLKYPSYNHKLKKSAQQTLIFDFIRKKWLVLTPEEWVRQHLLNYLVTEKKFPASSISVEKEMILNGQKKRYDVVVYDNTLKPYLIVECKAPYIELDQNVIEQAQRYNLVVKANILMITNGVRDVVFDAQNKRVELMEFER